MRMWALGLERPPLLFPIYTTGDQYQVSIITIGNFKNAAPDQTGRGPGTEQLLGEAAP